MEHYVPPEFSRKNEYLYYVGAEDSIKEEVKWRHGFQLVQNIHPENNNAKKKQKKRASTKTASIQLSALGLSSMTKVERKALAQERKQTVKAAWSSIGDGSS